MPQDTHGRWVPIPGKSELWIYTDSESYCRGEMVHVMVSSTVAQQAQLVVSRDGPKEEVVYKTEPFTVAYHPAPAEAYSQGCNWPVVASFQIPHEASSWGRSGFYILRGFCVGPDAAVGIETGEPAMAEHFFIIRPPLSSEAGTAQPEDGRVLLIPSTNTWTSYNSWGGASHYDAHFTREKQMMFMKDPEKAFLCKFEEHFHGSPVLSTLRPYTPGFVSMPPFAPRLSIGAGEGPRESMANSGGKAGWRRLPHLGNQQRTGGSWVLSSSWANYESYFYVWALRAGYKVDLCSNRDLARFGLSLLNNYRLVLHVGHDEYWSAGMRDAVDAYLDGGGRVARFAGNFFWQVRFDPPESSDRTASNGQPPKQICYKYGSANDPVLGTDRQNELTFEWESPLIGRPGCLTFGLNGSAGLYVRMHGNTANPGHAGSFTVYRPEHWAYEGTHLHYGDQLGGSSEGAVVFGFECDGLDYVMQDGLPFPTGRDGANVAATRILAVGPCDNTGTIHDQRLLAHCRYGSVERAGKKPGDESTRAELDAAGRGNGMIVEYRRGKGCVFHAGSTEWVVGLQPVNAADHHAEGPVKSPVVERITKNVLDRFLGPNPLPDLDVPAAKL